MYDKPITKENDMEILKSNADNTLRIVDWNGSFSVQFLYNGSWVAVADAETRQAANAHFKSFANSASSKTGSQA